MRRRSVFHRYKRGPILYFHATRFTRSLNVIHFWSFFSFFFFFFPDCFRNNFDRAIDAISLTWDNSHLKLILAHDNLSASNEPHSTNNINPQGQPLWHGKYCERPCLCVSEKQQKKKGKKKGHFNGHVAAKALLLFRTVDSLFSLSLSIFYNSTHTDSVCVFSPFTPSVFDSSFLFSIFFFFLGFFLIFLL